MALITVGILFLLGLLSLVPKVGRWLPSTLAGGFDAIIAGGDFTYWPSIGATFLIIGAMLWVAVVRLEKARGLTKTVGMVTMAWHNPETRSSRAVEGQAR